ncbi:hypothetical protein F7725_016907 [Dissostichus mawsoni]|uniref:Phosphoinositide phospholipase C n=1 Tax=Dissostichus mawsoni TaxID=36200 RepID=A0A7J5Z324_DISMA|nr:hypothetical protein F7725_016907 [Dissostichus mawsoni]
MRSPAGDIFNPEHNQVNQDMTQPLTNYFIATSHNTYLTGDQLLSQSRVEMYAYVLQAGCRCVEVDCWDGPDGEPIIHHGYTLTSKIPFKEVIETINKYAFTKSLYPVILSIENHCTVPQQKKMAEYLKEVLQDKLDLSGVNVHECKRLPSPEILKGKVLVKGKKLPANLDPSAEEGDRKKRLRVKNKTIPDGESDHSQEKAQIVYHPKKRKTMRLSRHLSDLVKYTKSVRVHDIETQAFENSWQVSSLNETVMNQILQLKAAELVRFNQRQLIRVYPSNYRVDSSNFNPQLYWNAGCHMVALNYQTEGRMLDLNRAKFSSNGNCGYILRPKVMCKGAFNPMLESPLQGTRKIQLVLKIISGQQIPKPKDSMFGDRGEIIDPYVEVEIVGINVDCSKQQTKVVDDNGFNPMWEETLVYNVKMPQIALVRFHVWDHNPLGREFIGQRTVALRSLMPGYRHVYLEGMAESSIFVHVAVNDMSLKSNQMSSLSDNSVFKPLVSFMTQMKPGNAVHAARKHIQKAAQKHMKGPQKQPSLDSTVQSSEDGRGLFFRKDLDTISQDSRNGEIFPLLQGPTAKTAILKGAMSEPLRRAHRVKIHEPLGTRRGIFSRMSSTDSYHTGAAPCAKEDSFDLETSPQASCEVPDSQNSIQEEWENELAEPPESHCAEQETVQRLEPKHPEQFEELPTGPDPDKFIAIKPEQPTDTQSQPDTLSLPRPQPLPRHMRQHLLQPEEKSSPPSPARMRRTLEAPATPGQFTPIRTKARSRSCPRKSTASPQTPMVNRRPAVPWQTQGAHNYSSYSSLVRPIPNGLLLSDSTSSGSGGSTDSLEFLPTS